MCDVEQVGDGLRVPGSPRPSVLEVEIWGIRRVADAEMSMWLRWGLRHPACNFPCVALHRGHTEGKVFKPSGSLFRALKTFTLLLLRRNLYVELCFPPMPLGIVFTNLRSAKYRTPLTLRLCERLPTDRQCLKLLSIGSRSVHFSTRSQTAAPMQVANGCGSRYIIASRPRPEQPPASPAVRATKHFSERLLRGGVKPNRPSRPVDLRLNAFGLRTTKMTTGRLCFLHHGG